jgi:hypothetical protein
LAALVSSAKFRLGAVSLAFFFLCAGALRVGLVLGGGRAAAGVAGAAAKIGPPWLSVPSLCSTVGTSVSVVLATVLSSRPSYGRVLSLSEDSSFAGEAAIVTVQYSTVQYSTVQYSTVQYSTVQYSTVQYSTVQYSLNIGTKIFTGATHCV